MPGQPHAGAPGRPTRCPCGSGETYDGCCGRLHSGEATAATPEQLMRARYSAFSLGEADFLLDSWHPSTRPDSLELDPEQRWTELEVLSSAGGMFDSRGAVRFRAHYRRGSGGGVLEEHSRFVREDGDWYYLDGS